MNKHTKLALYVAPILIILGYAGSDFYIEKEADKHKLYQLMADGPCDILSQTCVLKAGEFKINVFDKEGITTINSTFPLDSSTLFLVDEQNNSTAYPLGMKDSPYYWSNHTPLRENINAIGSSQKLRLIANIKGGKYIGEFVSKTN